MIVKYRLVLTIRSISRSMYGRSRLSEEGKVCIMERTFKVMDRTGDTEHRFAPTKAVEAEKMFDDLLKGRVAYKREGGQDVQVQRFADTNEETVFAPQLQGG